MSFISIFRQQMQQSSKVDASLVSLRYVHEISRNGDAIQGAELKFQIATGQEYTVLFAIGQSNLTTKVQRFLHPSVGKFGKERYQVPDWSTYEAGMAPVRDESGLRLEELVVSALTYDAKKRGDFDPNDLTVHKMFSAGGGKSLWAEQYSCFIYVDDNGQELSPAFGSRAQDLKQRKTSVQAAKQSLRERLAKKKEKVETQVTGE